MLVHRQKFLFLIILLLFGGQTLSAQWDWTSGQVTIHTLLPESFAGKDPSVKMGGLSGICYNGQQDVYYAISDKPPGRFYTLRVDRLDGTLTVLRETRITFSDVSVPKLMDPEAIRLTPDGKTLIWTNEAHSTVNLMDLEGVVYRVIQLPLAYQPDQKGQGIHNNSGLESLAISPDGSTLVVASEHILKQDEKCGSTWMPPYHPLRLVYLDLATGDILYEKLYYAQNGHGLVDMIWDEEGSLWCLERSWSPLTGNDILVYRADVNNGSTLKGHPRLCDLDPETTWSVKATLVHDFQAERKSGQQRRYDNVEGMTFGPGSSKDTWRMILVSDDNFDKRQVTQVIELSIHR
ncbi:MAG: esterase-like activity of phytase family protein [Saprospiraceae bacterium]|nr:esterase-like activity of phytase family protein [Saprospiraceae bacterium]